jgi:hypothetical protein
VPGLKVVGVVERIAPQATIRNNLKGFSARILLRDADPRVRPGMTANIKIPVASADNVVAVPLAAVFTEPDPDTGCQPALRLCPTRPANSNGAGPNWHLRLFLRGSAGTA